MDDLPDDVLHDILSSLSDARDVAACATVSSCWRACVPLLPALHFPRRAAADDDTIERMVESAARLEELSVLCPFSVARLPRWLAVQGALLRVLELRTEDSLEAFAGDRLDCIGAASNLEKLRLWGPFTMTRAPSWFRAQPLDRLRVLEIVRASLVDFALTGAIAACPNLTDLALVGCDCSGRVFIGLALLQRCRLDLVGPGSCALRLASPCAESLDIQGFNAISLPWGTRLRQLRIANKTGPVCHVQMGNLPELEQLSLNGYLWTAGALSTVLQCATQVKHLVSKVQFCPDFEAHKLYPELDLVEFFNTHPKLRRFEIGGAILAGLCQNDSLKNLDSRFVIPCLEEVLASVREPVNTEQQLNTLESFVRHSASLRRMVIRISQIDSALEGVDDFFQEICKFARMSNGIVQIE